MRTTLLFIGDEKGLRDFRATPDRRISTAKPEAYYGREVKLRRVALEVTQTELANLIGVHQVTLSRIETAAIALTSTMHARIEAVLQALEEQ